MPEISLTDFVDFVTRDGSPRLTKVKQLRSRGPYEPIHDFWGALRERLVDLHRSDDLQSIAALLDEVRPGQQALYSSAMAGHRKALGRREVSWFEPPRITWFQSGLGVRVNPELGLMIDGVPTIIKVNFRDKKLSKRRIECILLLMEDALRAHCAPEVRMAVLDLHRGKLFSSDEPRWEQRPYLASEAAAISTMWTELDRMERRVASQLWGGGPRLPLRSAAPLDLGADL